MLYVQQMLEQLQKSQEAARARQAAAAPPAEEEAQPPVQIDEWILQVSGHHSWLKLRVQVSVVVGALEQGRCLLAIWLPTPHSNTPP